jgi:hypothetical protein
MLISLWLLASAQAQQSKGPANVKLENDKVKVTEVSYQPGVPRERYIRPTL